MNIKKQSVFAGLLMVLCLLLCTISLAQNETEQPRFIPPPPQQAQPEPPDDQHLMRYDDLPLAIRKEFDRPKLSIHFYDDDPEKRYALINGFRGREGLPIGQELWIYRIRPDGVMMRIQDQFFLLEP